MNLEELVHEKEWRRCKGGANATDQELADAFLYFCHTYWHIRHPKRGKILFDAYDGQIEALRAFVENDRVICLKARQIGWSTLVAAYAFWATYFWNDRSVVMLSKGEREAAKLLQKSKYGFKFLPAWMKKRGPMPITQTTERLMFDNESGIESLPSGNDPARGESVWLAVLDEMAFLPNPDEAWASIEPITDVGGRVIALSTANGEGNIFHQLWVAAQDRDDPFVPLFFNWSTNGRDQSWYDRKMAQARRLGREWIMWQEYPDNAEEAFIRSGNPVFDLEKLRVIATTEPEVGRLVSLNENIKTPQFHPHPYGELRVWRLPVIGGMYVIGADVAEGLEHGDYSSAHVVAAGTGEVCATWHGHVDPDLYGANVLAQLGWWYMGALIGVESNNHGLTTLKALQRAGYPNIYRQRREGQAHPTATEILGWRTTSASKPLVIDGLVAAIREQTIDLRDELTVREMRTFRRDEKGRMNGSPHDDRVMSLAIGWQMLNYAFLPEYRIDQKPIPFSLDWFAKMAEDERNRANQPTPIGSMNVRQVA